MSKQQPDYQIGFFESIAVFIIFTAVEAFGINLVWDHVVTLAFGVKPLLFGHVFIMWLAFKVCFRDFFKLGDILDILEEIRGVQLFETQNRIHRASKETEKSVISDDSDK